MPYSCGRPTPSDELRELLTGKTAWEDAKPSIRSWARLPIYQAAVRVLDEPGKGERRNMLARIPAPIRPLVEAEALALWRARQPRA